jgi:hypothetical protein
MIHANCRHREERYSNLAQVGSLRVIQRSTATKDLLEAGKILRSASAALDDTHKRNFIVKRSSSLLKNSWH